MEVHDMAGHLIRRLHQISTSLFQARMKDAGLDLTAVQFATLTALHDHPRIDQATLAGLIAYDRATIGGVVDRMVAKGLVARAVNERDRRAKVLTLTGEGAAVLERMKPVVRAMQTDILTGLSDTERAVFLELAARAAAAGNDFSRAPLRKPDTPPEDGA